MTSPAEEEYVGTKPGPCRRCGHPMICHTTNYVTRGQCWLLCDCPQYVTPLTSVPPVEP